MPFWQPWWSVFAKKPKYFPVNERKWSRISIFWKKFFFLKTLLWTPRHQIRRHYWNLIARSRKSFTRVRELNRILRFQLFFLKLFPWTRKMQLRQPYWKISVKVLKQFGSNSKNDEKEHIFFPKKVFFLKQFPWTLKLHFWQNCRIFFAKSPKSFCSKYDINENIFFSKLLFPQSVPRDTETSILTSLRNYFRWKLDKCL